MTVVIGGRLHTSITTVISSWSITLPNHDEAAAVRPLTPTWVRRHLEVGERIVRTEALRGGITAEIRRPTVDTRDGGTRGLALRTLVDVAHAEDWPNREADALTLLTGTGLPAPELVAVDPTAAHCEYPSLLKTHLAGRTVLDDEGTEARIPLLAHRLVAIHALRPAERPREPGRHPDHRRRGPGRGLLGPGGPRCRALLHQSRAAARPGVGSAVRRGVRGGRRGAGSDRERAGVLAGAGRAGVLGGTATGGAALAGGGQDRADDPSRGAAVGCLRGRPDGQTG